VSGTSLSFRTLHRDGDARAGVLATAHGEIETPAFMPVATYGAVRGVAPDELAAAGATVLLANTYHLHERPGEDVVAALGGLHGFTGWRGPWLTDSGGFQVTSLADKVRVDEQGVTFASPVDGRRRALSPERVVAVQEALGSDVAMVLDECVRPAGDEPGGETRVRAATERTLRWAERSRRAHTRSDQWLFGIVQGGDSTALRRTSARATRDLGFRGFAHGGLGLGEDADQRDELVALTHAELPSEAPRYLMGLGRPADLIRGVACGVDLFDCVLPTRHARHAVLFTTQGLLRLKNAEHARSEAPPDSACDCTTCARYSRAYLRHLLRAGEALGARLATIHNLRFYLRLLERAREAIRTGQLAALRAEVEATEREDAQRASSAAHSAA
jgi:queuine tRNA-ribosyltransferase